MRRLIPRELNKKIYVNYLGALRFSASTDSKKAPLLWCFFAIYTVCLSMLYNVAVS